MLVLHANREQENTFQTLIRTMGEQVAWNGRFIVMDDQLILEGSVRSLFFQFDTRKVLTNLIDLEIKEEQVLEISEHPKLQDPINMILYAFGRWGTLKGLHVEQDFPQLNRLFQKILQAYYIEPSFRKENFRFFKEGMRITYEEVLETVLKFEEKPEDEPGAEAQGLWHKLVWRNKERVFQKTETTLEERQENRIGNNFYLVGYQCPKCAEKLFMAVYPEGNELRIDTDEKGVYLARAYTCDGCCCFYTPRPGRLIAEGIIYEMSFGSDRKAYEDYLELLGQSAQRTANAKYNEYEALRNQRLKKEEKKNKDTESSKDDLDQSLDEKGALRQMEDLSRRLPELPDTVFRRFAHRIEEGFYPDAAVARHEAEIIEQIKQRNAAAAKQPDAGAAADDGTKDGAAFGRKPDAHDAGSAAGDPPAGGRHAAAASSRRYFNPAADKQYGNASKPAAGEGHAAQDLSGGHTAGGPLEEGRTETASGAGMDSRPAGTLAGTGLGSQPADALTAGGMDSRSAVMTAGRDGGAAASRPKTLRAGEETDSRGTSENMEKYQARLGVLDRLSERQKSELKRQIKNDKSLHEYEKRALLQPIEEAEWKEKAAAIEKKVESGHSRNYAQIQKIVQEIEQEELPADMKRSFLDRLGKMQKERGAKEVQKLMENIPKRLDRAGYKALEKKLKSYAQVDLTPYAQTLRQKRAEAEKQEIANIVKRSRKVSRGDYVGLMHRLEEQDFADENINPYMEKIKDKVRELDEQVLDEITGNVQQMDFDAAAAAFEQISTESFLPELKNNALEMLSKRLEKIRTDECELLVRKLQEEMEGVIKENARHHFYPARKVMLKTAEPEETRAIDAALSTYAGSRNLFEYPIFTVDTSRNRSGREGMALTPENLFYGTRMSAYVVPVSAVASIKASTGLLNRRITLEEANGAKHRLPYAVGTAEMTDWAGILEEFIHYLQEKPASRKLEYLAKETHNTICCFRCGHVYHGGGVCPECGYKKNK